MHTGSPKAALHLAAERLGSISLSSSHNATVQGLLQLYSSSRLWKAASNHADLAEVTGRPLLLKLVLLAPAGTAVAPAAAATAGDGGSF